MVYRKRWLGILTFLSLTLAACVGATLSAQGIDTPTPATTQIGDNGIATPLPGNLDRVTFVEDGRRYIINQLIPRDGIRPIYNPQFVPGGEARFQSDELVMGVEINGDARAYPVGVLRSREIVNDEIGGTPVLVTW